MALGSLVPTTDSPVLVITSAIAIGVVFVLIMLLIVLRARHMALRRREAMRIQEQWEAQLILRFQDKPPMHQVWLSSPSAESSADDQRNGALNQSEWDKIMVRLFGLHHQSTATKQPDSLSLRSTMRL